MLMVRVFSVSLLRSIPGHLKLLLLKGFHLNGHTTCMISSTVLNVSGKVLPSDVAYLNDHNNRLKNTGIT